jgi:hypothetical protein
VAQIENELKYELDQAAYERILSLLPAAAPPKEFSNVYFEARGGEGRRDWNLRLRQVAPPGGELTLKVGRETSPGVFCATEYTAQVDSDEPTDWEDTEPMRALRQAVASGPVTRQGEIRNRRCLLTAPFGPVANWELDRAELPGGSAFHELEIEYSAQDSPSAEDIARFRRQLEEWLRANNLPVQSSRKTKYRRFLESLSGS